MATIPKEIQDGIKALSEKKDIPVKNLISRLKEIMEEDESIQAMEKTDFKIRVAWAALYKEYVSSGGQRCEFMPLSYVSPRSIRSKDKNRLVCDVSALIRKIENEDTYGEWEYAVGTFWDEAAKNLESLEKDKVYETEIIISDKDRKKTIPFGKLMISNNATFKLSKSKAPSFQKFYNEVLEPKLSMISLSEIDLNESEYITDTKFVTVTILNSDIGEKDGNEYAYFEVMDETITGETKRLFCDPRNLEYLQGSMVIMGINIRDTSKKDEEPSMRANFQWILPTELSEKTTPPTSEDIIDITDEKEEGKGGEDIDFDEGENGSTKEEGDVFEL